MFSCNTPAVETGLDEVDSYRHVFENQRIGIVTNHTAYDSDGRHILDIFTAMEDVEVTALFSPEHGIRGTAEDGSNVESETDDEIPIYSLYGATKKPTPEMLADIDMLVFDIQDIGARFYTFIYTMALAMEATAENGKKFVVLDRPNPIGGELVQGNLLNPEFASFIGLYSLPVRHGMTVGELAWMFNQEGWLANGVQSELTVIPMRHWRRSKWYDDTGLRFIKPSPNMPDLQSAAAYPGVALLEGTNVSEGRGTPMPFQIFGAPWLDPIRLRRHLNDFKLPGVAFVDTIFTPRSTPGAALYPKHQDIVCYGAKVVVTDRSTFNPYLSGIAIVDAIHAMRRDSLTWREQHFDRLCGTDLVRKAILHKKDIFQTKSDWLEDLDAFKKMRRKYLFYLN